MWGPPHLSWLVVALQLQRERQRWHHAVAPAALDTDSDDGDLPGHPGWTYRRHGIGLCLRGPDGELLDADFLTETGEVIDVWFFATRVASVATSPTRLAEPRLWRWRPLPEVIVDGIRELAAAGLVRYTTTYENQLTLAPELEARAAEVAAELATADGQARWLALIEPEGDAAYVADHRAWLSTRVHASKRPGDLLPLALEGTTADEALALCRPLFGRKDWHEGRAIELLRARPDVDVTAEVAEVLRRADVATDHPFSPYQACAYLLERDAEPALVRERFDAWAGMPRAAGYGGHPLLADFAVLALERLPERALPLVRRALRGSVPIAVLEMAALLAAIDQRWCHRELAAALAEERRESHAYLAAALRSTTSELAQRRGASDPGPPPRAPDAIGFSFDEVLHARADDDLTDELDERRTLAARLRARLPDDWAG
ncbi:MAG: hypothetical protein KBG48_02215 [Kofleriaceae bacterium]|nr:hypothetical protein [Kofleriaceae bacterium]MBP9166164.1 hypothetical protein [Kofleriaceae bacterium]MBP9856994.1 hypothetical protein [Kofleriaceae bacterium]